MKHFLLALFFCASFLPLTAGRPIKVACIGNSITYGTGTPNPETDSYPAQLQQLLGSGYEVGRFGKPGATLLFRAFRPYVKQPEFRQAMDFAGDIAVIHLGVNDTDPRAWPHYRDEFVSNYLALIDSFRSVNPKCKFFIARMTPISHRHRRFEEGTRDWHGEIQKCIETVAHMSGARLIDFYEPLHIYPTLMPDAIHPNKEGAGVMARVVYSAITGDFGGLKLSPLYTDGMVLQRDRALTLRGHANAGEKVKVSIADQNIGTRANDDGRWAVTLKPLKAGGPHTLSIRAGKQDAIFNDVLVGEVWLCSGQSNMEFHMRRTATANADISSTAIPGLRLFDMKGRWPITDVVWEPNVGDSVNLLRNFARTEWSEATPPAVREFSAVAYHFGRMLQDSLKVPVGLICNAVGGSTTEGWIDRTTLEYGFPEILLNWRTSSLMHSWCQGRINLNCKECKNPLQRHPYEPCYLYESGILPLEDYPIAGFLWYQGESNAHNLEAHDRLFPLLVKSWRKQWHNDSLPFYYVQLSGHDRPSWPWFRDSQRLFMQQVPHTAMAVSSDYGDSLDVHPRHKKEVGRRLARWALHNDYGFDHLTPSGPLFRSVEFREGAAWIQFEYGERLRSADGGPIRTFEVAEIDGLFEPATAEVTPEGLKVSSPRIKNPRYVRYAWQPFTRANLVNGDGLPASTFRSE